MECKRANSPFLYRGFEDVWSTSPGVVRASLLERERFRDQKTWGFASQYLAQVIMWKWTPQSSLPFLVREQMISFLPLSQQAYDYPRPRPSPLHAIPREFHTSSMTASHGAWKLRWHVSLAWLLIKPHKVPTTTMSPEFSRIILLSNILSQSLPKYVFCSV